MTLLETGRNKIMVDRGWIAGRLRDSFETSEEKAIVVGFPYRGDKLRNGQSSGAEIHPKPLSDAVGENCGSFVIKQVGGSDLKKANKLEMLKKEELMQWYCTPSTHESYARFWMFVTAANVVANLIVWFS